MVATGHRWDCSEEVQVIIGVFEVGVGEDGRELEKKRKRVRRCGNMDNGFGLWW